MVGFPKLGELVGCSHLSGDARCVVESGNIVSYLSALAHHYGQSLARARRLTTCVSQEARLCNARQISRPWHTSEEPLESLK